NYGFGFNHLYLKRLQQRFENMGEKNYDSQLFVDGQIGYYPSTRTYFDLGGNIGLINRSDKKVLDREKYGVYAQLATSGYYYISEKLRLGYSVHDQTGKYGIFNENVENTYHNALYYTLNLNYAIF
ncbi:MAG TPA: hypothetical protein VLA03_02805, partial [Draconibacterium sp.]|nr:hypothetical protein [Draconibacterium sp.]